MLKPQPVTRCPHEQIGFGLCLRNYGDSDQVHFGFTCTNSTLCGCAGCFFRHLPVYFVVLYAAYRERVGTLLQDALMTAAFVITLAGALFLRAALGLGQPFQGIH
jgi:hypothetical protein